MSTFMTSTFDMQSFVVSQLSLQTKESRDWNNFLLKCLSRNAWDIMDTLQMSHSSGSLTAHWIWRAIPNYFDCLQLLFVTAILSKFLDWNHLDFFIIIITKVKISLFTSGWHSEIRQENLKINIGISITLYNRHKVAKIEDIWSFLLFKLLSISWRDGKDTRALFSIMRAHEWGR